MKKNILFIHQSSDLYGSDKTLLSLVVKLNKDKINPIVVLPKEGLLLDELIKNNIHVIVTPVVKIHKKMFNFKEVLSSPFRLIKSIITLNRELKGIKLDLIQSNTVVVLLGFIYAKLKGVKHFWHIHEVMESPKIAVKFFSTLVNKFSHTIIFNSHTTRNSFCKLKPQIKEKSIVIYNGIDRISPIISKEKIKQKKELLKLNKESTLLGLVGRINNNKGHVLLINAFNNLIKKHANIELILVGSVVKGKEKIKHEIDTTIKQLKLENRVKFINFQKNIWHIWDIIDIAVVPSTIQESFGLVALEAMLSNKPVVCSDIGALKEIVVDKESGILFKAKDVEDLTKKLETLIVNEDLRDNLSSRGSLRAKYFSLEKYITSFEKIYI